MNTNNNTISSLHNVRPQDSLGPSTTSNVSSRQSSETATVVVSQTITRATGDLTNNSEETVLPLTLRARATVTW